MELEINCLGLESNRMWASASFVGVLIVLGVPLWWKTTEVYRVALPFDKISSFKELPYAISSQLTVLAYDEPTASEIASLVKKTFEKSDVINLKIKKVVMPEHLHQTLDSVVDEQEAIEEVAALYNLTENNQFFLVQRKPLFEHVWLAGERVAFFRDTKAAEPAVQALQEWVYRLTLMAGARAEAADAARRTRVPPATHYHVALSVVQPRPQAARMDFSPKDAVEDYVGTFVDELEVLHEFTLKSQWLYLLEFDFQARQVKDTSEWGHHYAVRQDRLHLLLTLLEERAATHVSEQPNINLALYAVPCDKAPIVFYDNYDKPILSPVQAFMSPKWGGVVVGSPTVAECRAQNATYRPNVPQLMGAFLAQLRPLLGIADYDHISGAHLELLRSVVPRRWEVDGLLRLRTLEQLTTAQLTLQSLAQLLGEISNIVINDEVGASINLAVESIHQAIELMTAGDLVEAYEMSQRAFKAAETAFMEPSLLALLYFPDDQKYAIYIPLFLPVMVPVVLSLKNLLRWLRGKPTHKEKTE